MFHVEKMLPVYTGGVDPSRRFLLDGEPRDRRRTPEPKPVK